MPYGIPISDDFNKRKHHHILYIWYIVYDGIYIWYTCTCIPYIYVVYCACNLQPQILSGDLRKMLYGILTILF